MIMDSNQQLQEIIEMGASYSDDVVKDELIKFIRSGYFLFLKNILVLLLFKIKIS